MPDGKLQVLTTTQIQQPATTPSGSKTTTTQNKTVIKSGNNTPTGKVLIQGNQVKTIVQSSSASPSPVKAQQVIVKQTPSVQKIAAAPNTVVVSGNQVLTQQQLIVTGNQVISSPAPQQVSCFLSLIDLV